MKLTKKRLTVKNRMLLLQVIQDIIRNQNHSLLGLNMSRILRFNLTCLLQLEYRKSTKAHIKSSLTCLITRKDLSRYLTIQMISLQLIIHRISQFNLRSIYFLSNLLLRTVQRISLLISMIFRLIRFRRILWILI